MVDTLKSLALAAKDDKRAADGIARARAVWDRLAARMSTMPKERAAKVAAIHNEITRV